MARLLLLPRQSVRSTDSLSLSLVTPLVLLRGFQLYAVEKWLVDRSRPLTSLTVYTGHQDHVLPVAVYTTPDQQSWDKIMSFLKRDGARQRLTEHGCVMVTSLAHFRSDYTIVHVPDGDFPAHRDHLYANINLLRLNCAGRSALTLEEPSDSTKDRFISTYLIPDVSLPNSRTRDRVLFVAIVLELVKLLQAALSLFGMYPGSLDGLLCDTTVDGIRRWIADVGEPIIELEPTECIADPMFVSALLTLVLSVRNKLFALGYNQYVPKDPFLQPQTLSNALAAFVHNNSTLIVPTASSSTRASSIQGHVHSLSLPNTPNLATLAPPLPIAPRVIVLNQSLIDSIDASYDSKHRPTESRKVRRAIKEKLDDLAGVVAGTVPDTDQVQDQVRRGPQSTLDLTGTGDRGGSGSLVGSSTTLGGLASGFGRSNSSANGLSSIVEPFTHLARLVKLALGGSPGNGWARGRGKQRENLDFGSIYSSGKEKDKEAGVGASIRALWSGHINQLTKMREWYELAGSTDKETKIRGRDRLATRPTSEGEENERLKRDGTEDESDQIAPTGSSFWGGKMHRTLESFTSRHNRRRTPGSLDLNASPTKAPATPQKDDAIRLNTVQQSPYFSSPSSPLGMDDDDMVLTEAYNSPMSSPGPPKTKKFYSFSSPHRWTSIKRADISQPQNDIFDVDNAAEDTLDLPYSVCRDDTFLVKKRSGLSLEHRRSFHDLESLRDMLVLTPEQMRIDVELCGQMLVMVRRQEHLHNITACLKAFESSLSTASSLLRQDYESHLEFIASLDPTGVFADINGEYKKAEEMSQQTKTLMYESKQFNTADLWHAVNHSRQKVFELRHKVFGAGSRRLPPGVEDAHGSYNRLQWTLDGKRRLVDIYGRTEKEVEEEAQADPHGLFSLPVPEEEKDVVEHPSMKPMWLLQLFTRWGAHWGAQTATRQESPAPDIPTVGTSTALESKTDTVRTIIKPSD